MAFRTCVLSGPGLDVQQNHIPLKVPFWVQFHRHGNNILTLPPFADWRSAQVRFYMTDRQNATTYLNVCLVIIIIIFTRSNNRNTMEKVTNELSKRLGP